MVRARNGDNKKHIQNLRNHPSAFVTPAELAKYWHLTSAELRKYIEGGALKAIRFGTSLFRIRTKDAIEFQRRKRISPRRRPRQSKRPKVGLN